MTQTMLETLRTGNAVVRLSLYHYPDGSSTSIPIAKKGGKWCPPPNTFVYLRTKVTNLTRKLILMP